MKKIMAIILLLSLPGVIFSQGRKKKEPKLPDFIKKDIEEYKKEGNSKQWPVITRYEYKGKFVYYFQMPCCDQINSVWDSKGQCMGTPDGGMMGKPVSNPLPDFNTEKKNPKKIWPEDPK